VDEQVYTPARALGGLRLARLSTGSAHACGIGLDQIAYCWGGNYAGSLGDGDAANTFRPAPTAVRGNLQFAQIIAGYLHTCGLTTAGAGYCWGYNSVGELGAGDQELHNVPAAVLGGQQFRTISTRPGSDLEVEQNSCGLALDSTAWCWGGAQGGTLGTGADDGLWSNVPAPVSGGRTFTTLEASGGFVCGITPEADLYCWGRGASEPTLTGGGLQWAKISLGMRHACGITTAGQLYCWGANESGQLGLGRGTPASVPSPSLPYGVDGITWREVAAGGTHTCAIATDGGAWCWGRGEEGELGIGDLPAHAGPYVAASPVPIATSRPLDN
jgi:alpha-tubulin suppressor-like RCC1 family protein